MVPLLRVHTQLGSCVQTRIRPGMSLFMLSGSVAGLCFFFTGSSINASDCPTERGNLSLQPFNCKPFGLTGLSTWYIEHCCPKQPGKSSFLMHQEPRGSKGLWSLVGLIAKSPVDVQVQNTFPAHPGKFAPLQQCLNAPSTWFCSHSHETERPHQKYQIPQRDGNFPSATQC